MLYVLLKGASVMSNALKEMRDNMIVDPAKSLAGRLIREFDYAVNQAEHKIYMSLSKELITVFENGLILWIILIALLLICGRISVQKLNELAIPFFLAMMVAIILRDPQWYVDMFVTPARETTWNLVAYIFKASSQIYGTGYTLTESSLSGPVKIVALTEMMLINIGLFSWELIKESNLSHVIGGLILFIPYLIFVTFYISIVFVVLLILFFSVMGQCITFPLLPFQKLRGFYVASWRVFLGGALLVFFSTCMLGLIISTISDHQESFAKKVIGDPEQMQKYKSGPLAKVERFCTVDESAGGGSGIYDPKEMGQDVNWVPKNPKDENNVYACKSAVDEMMRTETGAAKGFQLFDKEYLLLVLMPICGIVGLFTSYSVASNLSGASISSTGSMVGTGLVMGGAAAAAATTKAAQDIFNTGRAVTGSMTPALSAGGFGSFYNGGGGAESFYASKGGTSGRSFTSPGQSSGQAPAGSANLNLDPQTMKKLSAIFTEAINNSNLGKGSR